MTDSKPLALVAGAGPGLGMALLRRFQDGGYKVVGLTRMAPETSPHDIKLIRADLSCPEQATAAIQKITDQFGPPKIVIHNTAQLIIRPFLELDGSDFERAWRSMTLTMVYLAKAVLPKMIERDGSAFLVSGATASLRGGSNFAVFSSAKFALRGLTQSLAREFQPQGVHIAHVILDGMIDSERSRALHDLAPALMMKPKDIADAYWMLAHQRPTPWSHEIDLRSMTESF